MSQESVECRPLRYENATVANLVSEDGWAVGVITNGSSVEIDNEFHDCNTCIMRVIQWGVGISHDILMIVVVPGVSVDPSFVVETLEVPGEGFM